MKIHEYQAKEIFAAYGIPVPRERVAATPAEARSAAEELGLPVVLKAQVLVGGRGKAGGVKKAGTLAEVETVTTGILNMTIKGLKVQKVLVSEAVAVSAEYYLGITIDRAARAPVLLASAAGGVEIEEVAKNTPEKIIRTPIDPLLGLLSFQARNAGITMLKDTKLAQQFTTIAQKLYRLFIDRDCSLVEINPLVLTGNGSLLALDAKINFDDNALFRHPENESLRDLTSEEPAEMEAKQAGLSYIKLSGNVGCVVNGAGLAMATMDLIKRYGGEPANFLDVGGSSSPDKMALAMRIILSDPNVKAILVNIFGGITRCDDIAQGLLLARQQADIRVPVIARLVGTNADKACALLENSPILFANTMAEAVRLAVTKAKEAR
ncbi:MAG: ADP-forming succinate--CoA ligase subunit beta [candidate division WOR-3 bacterium]|uniref:Succinate--CoA ligase [ADP-forming] subunit beta n=1 Tax=candidate division WOR-3 bacterium TaxID=2052148 RepID=A0A7C1NE98_UNCW3|nr:ADP-forming succinate--CoA ligase subunit beta [candidate division WOR-3 bacterium]